MGEAVKVNVANRKAFMANRYILFISIFSGS